jgi:DNA-3-methyladenine glycosylase
MGRRRLVGRRLLGGDAPDVAPQLLWMVIDVAGVSGRITEVEAYTSDDPASHTSRGRTPRNATMFERPGTLYVYLIYGVHLCANVVTGSAGDGQAVLIRAILPVAGIAEMRRRRAVHDDRRLADGPGKLCQALGIAADDDGADVCSSGARVRLFDDRTPAPVDPVVGTRIGISAGVDRLWNWRLPISSLDSDIGH